MEFTKHRYRVDMRYSIAYKFLWQIVAGIVAFHLYSRHICTYNIPKELTEDIFIISMQ